MFFGTRQNMPLMARYATLLTFSFADMLVIADDDTITLFDEHDDDAERHHYHYWR